MDDPCVLLVDDDEHVLRSVKRLLERDALSVLTTSDPQQALDLLACREVGVIISDHRMPGMEGTELLRRAREVKPDTVRMLLTGSAEVDAAVAAVNDGAVYKLLLKPWDDGWLRGAVAEAIQHFRAVAERKRLAREIEEANRQLRQLNEELEQAVRSKAQELQVATRYDPLTRLPNREYFGVQLARALREAQASQGQIAVIVLDLDRFKAVNDTLSHAAGDQLLRHVAERISGCLRRSDLVARVGSDEFAVGIIGGVDSELPTSVARRILGSLAQPYSVAGREVYLTASLGVSLHPADGSTAEDLLKRADLAMHHAKESGGNRFEYFAEEMNARLFERLVLESALRGALEREEYRLFYQPTVDLGTGAVVGAEALLRWYHPELGLVSPVRFIPLLEETGLIHPVGEWVLREACRTAARWRPRMPEGFRIAVNLSPHQLAAPDLAERTARILEGAGFPPPENPLTLEITESGVMTHPEAAVRTLERFNALGFRLAVDDFGTGYSSLAYLRRFPIHALKIDRSFVHDLPENESDASIVRAVVALARGLGLRVVAEGVETEDQAAFLRELGCDRAQGYLFGRPVPEAEAEAVLLRPVAPSRPAEPAPAPC
ncbi:MAG: hypothetical protein Kow0092_30970 [Deferrisomatales bacterium]